MAMVQKAAAGVNHVRDVAFAFILVGHDEWIAQAADDFSRIVMIKQERADAIFPHRSPRFHVERRDDGHFQFAHQRQQMAAGPP